MHTWLFLLATLAVWKDEGSASAYDLAWEAFQTAPEEIQQSLVEEIKLRIEQSQERGLKKLLELRDQALKELEVVVGELPGFYDPEEYAPSQRVVRRYVDPESDDAARKRATYRPGENVPQFYVRVRYDFGLNKARLLRSEMPPIERMYNYWIEALPPDADYLLAWLQMTFDHNDKYDELALHFAHDYCTLDARCYRGITIYDAFASEEGMDMPDVDVIPFAIQVKRDRSFKSPIPPGSKRARLYEDIKEAWLPYFQHRSFVEEAAYLFLNPSGWLRPEHEGLRNNLLYLVADKDEDIDQIVQFFKRHKDRSGFMDGTLKLVKRDRAWKRKIDAFVAGRNEARFEVQRVCNAVMREHGFLKE